LKLYEFGNDLFEKLFADTKSENSTIMSILELLYQIIGTGFIMLEVH
jgi:hypothetical protein